MDFWNLLGKLGADASPLKAPKVIEKAVDKLLYFGCRMNACDDRKKGVVMFGGRDEDDSEQKYRRGP